MYEAVIFDLDGTILNTLDDLADSANYVLKSHGFPVHPTESYKRFVGNGIPKLIERVLPTGFSEEVFEAVLKEFSQYYDAHKSDKTAPYPGIPETLGRLKAQGLKLCVLSNKQHELSEQIVRQYFGDDTFDIICGKLEQFPPKPDPTSCNYMISELNIPKADILYVGDSNVDMQTAANAGLTKCGVGWGFRGVDELTAAGADYIAASPNDIISLVLGKNK